jgi:predicted metal-dependent enzyme (double-stranded beta helix superfamily)
MPEFDIEDFARGCKQAMQASDDRHAAARRHLQQALEQHDSGEIVAVLDAAIPAGADIGEMIVHCSPELTMLYARIPPRFQTGIHDHTVFACIGQLVGRERNTFYRQDESGNLAFVGEKVARPGEIVNMPADAIHCIENPDETASSALHVYGGDFRAVQEHRSLWTSVGHEKRPFSFEELLRESAAAMSRDGNTVGLEALVEAIPAARAFVEG